MAQAPLPAETSGRSKGGPYRPRALPAPRATYATLVVFGSAVSITGYYATDQQDEAANRERGSQATRAVSVMPMRHESGARMRPPLSSSAAADGSVGDEAVAQIEWTVPQAPPSRFQGAPAGKKAPREGRSAGTEAPRPIGARGSYPESPPAPTDAPENVAASRAAPAPEAQVAATSDRRQVMAAAVSRCERENFLAAFLCKERAWLQFCDGQWGEEPQCPSGVRSNSTR